MQPLLRSVRRPMGPGKFVESFAAASKAVAYLHDLYSVASGAPETEELQS